MQPALARDTRSRFVNKPGFVMSLPSHQKPGKQVLSCWDTAIEFKDTPIEFKCTPIEFK